MPKVSPYMRLKRVNNFKVPPISYPATIGPIERGVVQLQVREELAYATGMCRFVFISSPLLKYSAFVGRSMPT